MSRLIVSYEDHYEVCHLLGRCCLVLLQEGSLHMPGMSEVTH
jgi:hypothetical protein